MRLMTTAAMLLIALGAAGAEPLHEAELLFPLESWHNHGSCIVECPNGDLLTCWFHGSGERKSDDVLIEGARKVKGADGWSARFVMADTPGFPDTNCCMIIDPQQRLWLLWPTIQANLWESALMKYKISDNYMMAEGAPEWNVMKVLHAKPGDDFEEKVQRKANEYLASVDIPEAFAPQVELWKKHILTQAADKLTRRLGWFTRAHPLFLEDGRLLVGLYSDGFSFSLVAISDDLGETWSFSDPIVGGGNIQPSFARKRDGTLVAFMRDNGPAPKRVMVSESSDRGETWSTVYDHPIFNNPGSGLELMTLSDGDWVVIYNDEPMGRHSLAVSLSDDEGATWKWTRHLELVEPGQGSFHYPSIIEGSDGNLHASYSYFVRDGGNGKEGKSIKYAKFNKAWIKQGDPAK
ncbi:MAG: neuraminidase (sialidase)-like protein [Nitrospiraceae bacterium]|nr:neuraminidase (sialidase)-like protein [Nitrospiraceae bacterium]